MLTAAFYRRDVLSALGGLEAELGDELADIGIALAMQSLGRLHVSEPGSQLIQTNNNALESKSGSSSGRAAERLFCRHVASRGLVPALLLHPLTVMSDMAGSGSVIAGVAALAGRCLAWLEFGAGSRYEQRIADAKERLAELQQRCERRCAKAPNVAAKESTKPPHRCAAPPKTAGAP